MYHVAFLFEQAVIAARKKLWSAELWQLPFVGREWHQLFPQNMTVESCHIVKGRVGGAIVYQGKDEVRAWLLKYAFADRLNRSASLPGLSLLWRWTIRGTTSEAGIRVKRVSENLENEPVPASMFQQWSKNGTRCPECNQTRCDVDCRGIA